MAKKCGICDHPQVEEINAALVEGVILRKITENFSVKMTALHRHKQHIPAGLVKAQEAREVAKADTLLQQVANLRDKALSILAKAEQAGDLRTALVGIKEARGCLELLARLQGELQEQTTVNVLINPQWVNLRAVILAAMEPYPEARLKLAAALEEVESSGGHVLRNKRINP
ncbi:MAG: hypothetical protein KGZ57_08870 [Dethiobacter sp.]|nr:hypothetical protein [Dethiobacter sp.]